MTEETMSDMLLALESIQGELKGLGVPPEMADRLQGVMDRYVSAKEEIIKLRDVQFTDDAYNIVAAIKAISNRNQDYVARYLRRFAVHVARYTLNADKTISDPEDIVDRIPTIDEEGEAQ